MFTVEIRFLADCPHVVPAIACLQLMAIHSPENRDYDRSLTQYATRAERRDQLPLSLVAFADTLPVGSVSLVECDLDTHAHLSPWVASLVVWEEYRGRGIGRALMERVEDVGRSLGFPKLYLYTFSAEPLYRSMGWKSLGKVQPKRLPESVLMVKEFEDPVEQREPQERRSS